MTARAEDYAWSSAAAHCRGTADGLLSGDFPPPGAIADWREWLGTQPEEDEDRLRSCTKTGRPCGSASFVERLEQSLERPLNLQRPGPKARIADKDTGTFWK